MTPRLFNDTNNAPLSNAWWLNEGGFVKFVFPLLVLSLSPLVAAPVIDDFSGTSHVRAQNASELQLTLNSGSLEATRLQAGYTGFYWNLGPTVNPWDSGASAQALSLASGDQQFVLNLDGLSVINPGGTSSPNWAVWVFFFDSGGNMISGEQQLQADTAGVGNFSYNIQTWAAGLAPQYQMAAKYTPLIQVISSEVGEGYSFDGISAVPEPGSLVLAGLGALVFLRRMRRVS